MQFHQRLIERHLLGAIVTYMMLALFLLTGIILAQQAARFSEVMFGSVSDFSLLAETVIDLIPNVLIFTLPMAMLFGTVIGLSQLGSDSEIIALRASGLGNRHILLPILLIGIILSAFAFYLNYEIAPNFARKIKQSVLRAALRKLDSPVEPNSFYPDIPGYIVFVRDGNKDRGDWGRVFIYAGNDKDGTRLITARTGRIDSSSKQTELVLNDTEAIKLPPTEKIEEKQIIVEKSKQIRLLFDTGRNSIIERLQNGKLEIDELDWAGLMQYIGSESGIAHRDGIISLHKRLNSSVGAIVLALLGIGTGLRVKKGGRGIGVLLSLTLAVVYYLLTLIGEQLSRAGTVPPDVGPWLPTVVIIMTASVLISRQNSRFNFPALRLFRTKKTSQTIYSTETQEGKRNRDRIFTVPGLLDIEIARDLTKNVLLVTLGLVSIFSVFTLFGIWKFIVLNKIGSSVVARYLFYLLPLMLVQILPTSVLVAALATYSLKARKSEIIAWCASGQSIYRLLIPGITIALLIVSLQWIVQERLMPHANIKQDSLRARIRGTTATIGLNNRQWLAAENGRIYSYEFEFPGTLKTPVIYDFDAENVHLERITSAQTGFWRNERELVVTKARSISLHRIEVLAGDATQVLNADPIEYFKPSTDKPSQLSSVELSTYINREGGEGAKVEASLVVALYRKYAAPFGPLIMALIGIPLALMFGRRSAMAALCVAIALGLSYLALSAVTQNLGDYRRLPPLVAAWSPSLIFTALGGYLLSRTRT